MKLTITHQDSYSRGELLLRSFFGGIYIMMPLSFIATFYSLAIFSIPALAFWAILFTGKYPKSYFELHKIMLKWYVRLSATLINLVDGFPLLEDGKVTFEIDRPDSSSRGTLLLRFFLGWAYLWIPHGFVLTLRGIWGLILQFLAWWVVLFTGKYPEGWHEFQVGTIRWGMRFLLYAAYLTDEYPPFSGK